MNNKVFWAVILYYGWLAGILIVSSIPNLGSDKDMLLGSDKFAHFTVYLILAVLFILMKRIRGQAIKLPHYLFLSIPLPFLEELHQVLIPGRQFSLLDYVADWAGVSVIFAGYYFLRRTAVIKL
jgi:VanZ family protein